MTELFDEWWVGLNRFDTLEDARAAQRHFNGERMTDWADRCLVEKVEEVDEFGPRSNWERYVRCLCSRCRRHRYRLKLHTQTFTLNCTH